MSQAPTAANRQVDVETLRQALAELEDAKQRLRRDNERELERMRGRVLEGLLPVLDNLERSIAAASVAEPGRHNVQALLQGMKLVHSQFLASLAPFGLERISSVGARFDPLLHDAIAIVPVADPKQDGIVVAEIEPAYRVAGKVVRPAKVQVGKAGGTLIN